ncbi:MAG: biopolymer transporter ExbD [Ignavibacteriales bacterium]|nr:MAG: biopolymer transporter ExbD [Ignavibacteriales bacterium]
MKFKTSNQPLAAFSHSSLTDITMLLLIYFLLTSQFVMHSGVKVKLPGSKTNEQAVQTKMIITVTSDGRIYAGAEETSIAELPTKLSILKSQTNENNLIIRADKTVQIELIIKIMDTGKGIGIDKFTIETEKVTEK